MKTRYENFIGFYEDVFPNGYCQHLIKEFNILEGNGAGSNRQDGENAPKSMKEDHSIMINCRNPGMAPFEWANEDKKFIDPVYNMFFGGLQKCYNDYVKNYSAIDDGGRTRAEAMKAQKTPPGGGYHIWHSEQGAREQANRVVVYMLYLNTLDCDGGETEFLYHKMRIKPKENLMLLWPAAFTHAHRGNPPLGQDHKYVVTGWFYYD